MLAPAQLFADFGGHMDWDGGWGIAMLIGMILFWILVLVAAVWLLREIGFSRRAAADTSDDPLRVLDRRLAEGAISIEEYRQRREVLLDVAKES